MGHKAKIKQFFSKGSHYMSLIEIKWTLTFCWNWLNIFYIFMTQNLFVVDKSARNFMKTLLWKSTKQAFSCWAYCGVRIKALGPFSLITGQYGEWDKKRSICLWGVFGLNKFTFSHCSMLTTNVIIKRYLSGENGLKVMIYNVLWFILPFIYKHVQTKMAF